MQSLHSRRLQSICQGAAVPAPAACIVHHHAQHRITVSQPPESVRIVCQQPLSTGWDRRSIVACAGKGFGAAKVDPAKLQGQTCPCGSKKFYRDCCEPYHEGREKPPTADAQLRARFSAFVKNKQDYIVNTFHPSFLPFKYPDYTDGDPAEQLKRDVKMACTSYTYSGLKILNTKDGSNPDEAFVEFQYSSQQKATEKRTNSRQTRVKAAPVDRNLDGSIKVAATVERSRFLHDDAHGWRFADYELVKYPDWMAEAKEAELKSRQQQQGAGAETQPGDASMAAPA